MRDSYPALSVTGVDHGCNVDGRLDSLGGRGGSGIGGRGPAGMRLVRQGGALLDSAGWCSIDREAHCLDSMESKMNDQVECEACFGTGNDNLMHAPRPGHKILFRPCPACAGTGKRESSTPTTCSGSRSS